MQIESLLSVVENLSSMLTSQCDQANAQEVAVVNNVKQSCLFSVRLLCKMVGKEYTDQFIKVRALKVTKILISTDH